ncbi:hypothetical protein N9H60_02190 [Flavimaricola sp.]|nr:hypothetical protein [Flavimaricola sp.]MDA9019969.1 hypothetical protein [Flavimaricola sp.]
MADKAIFEITPEDQQLWGGSQTSVEPLFRLRHQLIEDEVNHTLINLAICNRTHMERRLKEHQIHFPSTTCGKWMKDVSNPDEIENLPFRESCNKIIHADKFAATFLKGDTVTVFSGEMEPMHHEMRLSGKYSGKKWRADLNVLDFLRVTAKNFELF